MLRLARLTSALALVLLVPLAACGRGHEAVAAESGALSGKLTLSGSSTVAPLVAEIAKRFEAEHPGVRIDVQTGGSGRGIADARSGLADIGMASRALKPDEAAELDAHTIARDGVCVIVHAQNPIESLTDDQVRAIYTGEVERWSEIGGADEPITVVNKASGRATLEVFLAYFALAEQDVEADVVIGDNQQGIKTVVGNPSAIAYVSIGTAEHDVANGVPLKLLPTAGVPPTTKSVGAGAFPVGRPLELVTSGELSALQRAFIEYCRSAEVHDVVRDLAFVPAAGAE